MADSTDLVSLRQLEAELGLERAELLLLLRQHRIEPLHKGLRTYLSVDQVDQLRSHYPKDSDGGALTVLELEPAGAQAGPQWSEAGQFAQVRLLRERLELLLLCADRGLWLESGELAPLLGLRRVVARDQDDQGAYFDRYGIRFRRQDRPGQRSAWRIISLSRESITGDQ
ncbi:MAG: hypothetical protein RLZZ158_775 [Cyanobacteriota bacterium]|jgi:hypothetical protein